MSKLPVERIFNGICQFTDSCSVKFKSDDCLKCINTYKCPGGYGWISNKVEVISIKTSILPITDYYAGMCLSASHLKIRTILEKVDENSRITKFDKFSLYKMTEPSVFGDRFDDMIQIHYVKDNIVDRLFNDITFTIGNKKINYHGGNDGNINGSIEMSRSPDGNGYRYLLTNDNDYYKDFDDGTIITDIFNCAFYGNEEIFVDINHDGISVELANSLTKGVELIPVDIQFKILGDITFNLAIEAVNELYNKHSKKKKK